MQAGAGVAHSEIFFRAGKTFEIPPFIFGENIFDHESRGALRGVERRFMPCGSAEPARNIPGAAICALSRILAAGIAPPLRTRTQPGISPDSNWTLRNASPISFARRAALSLFSSSYHPAFHQPVHALSGRCTRDRLEPLRTLNQIGSVSGSSNSSYQAHIAGSIQCEFLHLYRAVLGFFVLKLFAVRISAVRQCASVEPRMVHYKPA